MKNYNCYIKNLKKSMQEKLFFLDKIDLHNKVIIDFGCADGEMISILAEEYQDSDFIGIEKDQYLLNLAKQKNIDNENVSFLNYLSPIKDDSREIILICSSVLHELSVNDQYDLNNYAKNYCDYWIIRDMKFSGCKKINNNMLSNIILNANPKNLSEFVYKYGIKSNKDIVHYLLKYTYLDNWETELEENYFGTCWSLIEKDKDIIYIDDYLLEYKKKQVLKDFYIDLSNFKTHRKVIYKINKMNK